MIYWPYCSLKDLAAEKSEDLRGTALTMLDVERESQARERPTRGLAWRRIAAGVLLALATGTVGFVLGQHRSTTAEQRR
jgi:hypothetical protein